MENRFRVRAWLLNEKRYAIKITSFNFDDKNRLQEIEELQNNGRFCTLYKSDNYILEQCTGVEDKNGNLAYENDIIEITSPVYDHYDSKPRLNKNIEVVKWRENQTGFYPFCYGIHQEYEETTFEIIGNIHENK